MADKSDNPVKFWEELKRRNVFSVVAMYAASAFIALEAVDIIFPRWGFPDWTINLVIVLLIIGLFIAAILAWIFDITPEGIQKTMPATKIKEKVTERRKLKAGDLIISVLLAVVMILAYPKIFKNKQFEAIKNKDGKISVAVIPFENQTGDSTLSWLERGLSSLVINCLGSSEELVVYDDHTISEVIENIDKVFVAGFSPSIARDVASLTHAETYITGSYQGKEDNYSVMLNLVNTKSGSLIWTTRADGNLKSSEYLNIGYSLCDEIKDFLEIKALEQNADFDFREAYPKSSEAYRYFIEGMNLVLSGSYIPAIEYLEKALKIDSTFTLASFYIAYANCFTTPAQMEQARIWTQKAYNTKENLPVKYQDWLSLWYACYISKNIQDINQYCSLLEESEIESRILWFDLGVSYYSLLQQYEKAAGIFEQIEKIDNERRNRWMYKDYYVWFGKALHYSGKHDREKEIHALGLSLFSDNNFEKEILKNQAVCAVSQDDSIEAGEIMEKYIAIVNRNGYNQADITADLGEIYYDANKLAEAEKYFRDAFQLNPQNPRNIFLLSKILIVEKINISEGMELIQGLVNLYPDWAPALEVKGRGLYFQDKYEEALEVLNKSEYLTNTFKFDLYKYIQDTKLALVKQKSEQN